MAITAVTPKELHLDILPAATRRAFLYSTTSKLFKNSKWYLAGGTALALQSGHRQSVDLDFFTSQKSFNSTFIEEVLASGDWQTTLQRKNTLYGKLLKSKASFIAYPYFVPSNQILKCGNVRILVPQDIASMKIIALSQRGRKRDFIDLYWYCTNREPLTAVLRRALAQYPRTDHNVPHILKSLTYFQDAESEPMPTIFFDASWKKVKKFFQSEGRNAAREFFGIGDD